MATILNIETSTDICSVCIAVDGDVRVLRETPRSYSHSEVIAVFIDECLRSMDIKARDLDAVSISRGPGSYTALRIGSATAKGICFAVQIPLISIGTLDALADTFRGKLAEGELVVPMIDARRMEIYHAIYDQNLNVVQEVVPVILDATSYASLKNAPSIHILGDGSTKAKGVLDLPTAQYHARDCSAEHMVRLSEEKFAAAEFEDIAYYEPLYYKGANITVQKKNILR